MPTCERQKLITEIVKTVLGVSIETEKSFGWFKNKHTPEGFGIYFSLIDRIFKMLGGDPDSSKRSRLLKCDAYLAAPLNCFFEFDEYQHFSTARLKALELYPHDLELGFSVQEYKNYCLKHRDRADKYRHKLRKADFNFEGGRTAQRAYLDCFHDILPLLHGLNPTIRIAEFEVIEISSNNSKGQTVIERLLERKLHMG
jgi:hypothetical protein